jgi:hypothetical protein
MDAYVTIETAVLHGISQKLISGLDDGVFDQLAKNVSREIDRHLSTGGYDVPLEAPDDDIKGLAAKLLRWEVILARGADPSADLTVMAKQARDEAIATLEKIASAEQVFEDDDAKTTQLGVRSVVY